MEFVHKMTCREGEGGLRPAKQMGRVRYTDEEHRTVVHTFVEATRKIVIEKGARAVSIREISRQTGYSSATLYLYFADVDELLMYVGIQPLTKMCEELAAETDKRMSAEERYERAWRITCEYSFRDPDLFYSLFFGTHRVEITNVVQRYYSVFPEELNKVDPGALTILMQGDIEERGSNALAPRADELHMSDHDREIANIIVIDHYRCMLLELRGRGHSEEDATALAKEFLEVACFVTKDRG